MQRLGYSLKGTSERNNNIENPMIGLTHTDIDMDVVCDPPTNLDNANTQSPQDETFPRA